MNAATKPSTSACPRSDRPASCSPAAQPSVRSASAAATASAAHRAAHRRAQPLPGSRAAASSAVNRSSAGAQLGQLPAGPQPGQRPVAGRSAGQHQVQPGGRCSSRNPSDSCTELRADHVIVIQDQQRLVSSGWPATSLIRAVTSASNDGGAGGPEQRADPLSRSPAAARSSAATACRQNRAGSLSPASSDSQATGCRPRRTHSASRTVLPYPAGRADQDKAPIRRPSSSRCASRGRGTRSGPQPGHVQLGGQQNIALRRCGPAAADSPIGNLHDRRLQRSGVAARTHRSYRPPGPNSGPDPGGTIVPSPSRKIPPAWAPSGDADPVPRS